MNYKTSDKRQLLRMAERQDDRNRRVLAAVMVFPAAVVGGFAIAWALVKALELITR